MTKKKRSKLLAVMQSTLAAAFGVQSQKRHERDFREGRASSFIIAGVVFTVLFVLILLAVANLVVTEY